MKIIYLDLNCLSDSLSYQLAKDNKDSLFIYAQEKDNDDLKSYRIIQAKTALKEKSFAILNRTYPYSYETIALLQRIYKFKPDIIHIFNLDSLPIDKKMLKDSLNAYGVPVVQSTEDTYDSQLKSLVVSSKVIPETKSLYVDKSLPLESKMYAYKKVYKLLKENA